MKSIRAWLAAACMGLASISGAGAQTSAFRPTGFATLAVTSVSANVALPNGNTLAMVCNTGATEAFIRFGASNAITAVAATTPSTSLPAGACFPYDASGQTYFAAVTSSSTTTIRIAQGVGSISAMGGGSAVSIIGSVAVTGGATYGAAFPTTGLPAGFSDGTNMQPGLVTSGAIADGTTAPTSKVQIVQAYMMAYNNATWDRAGSLVTGTAGSAGTDVVTIQGIASMTPVTVQGSGTSTSATAQNVINSPGVGTTVLGSYCMSAKSGIMAAGLAGGSPVFSYRYGGAAIALVRKVTFSADDDGTGFTAGSAFFQLFVARSFSASDTGGTALTLTGNNGKLRTSYATTAVSDIRASATATLSAGTRTLDATPVASGSGPASNTASGNIIASNTALFESRASEQPIILAQNEGVVLQATVPATGTWGFTANVCWDEVSAF